MSRFANPTKTERFYFANGCKCPSKPHEQDWMALRIELGAVEVAQIEAFALLGAVGGIKTVAMLLEEWNLLDDSGQPAPANEEMVGRLWSDLFSDELNAWIEEHVQMASSLPNASGGRSANGSSATAHRTHGSRKRRSSTTSS